ncbi:MAG: glycosyltransferase, partial [Deltaproteobacteria bacterium]
MKIAIMLRCYNEKGGVGVYTRNLVDKLLEIDKLNEYFLFYSERENIGRYSDFTNVKELHLRAKTRFFWDQFCVPVTAKRYKVDIILNPKFSTPLITKKKSIIVQHGADWFVPEYEKFYSRIDVTYNKIFMPLYCRKASLVVSVSKFSAHDFVRYVKVPPEKIKTVYFGPAECFKPIKDNHVLEKIRSKLKLPEKFIF